jgi:hypothetical protein
MSFTFRAGDNPQQFDASPYAVGTFFRFQGYDDEYDPMGKCVLYVQEVLAERGVEFAGALLDCVFCGSDDADYVKWVKAQKGKIVYHLCECAAGDCKVKIKAKKTEWKGKAVIHVDVRTALTQDEVKKIKWAIIPDTLKEVLRREQREPPQVGGGGRRPSIPAGEEVERRQADVDVDLRSTRGDLEEELERLSRRMATSGGRDSNVQERLQALREKLGKHRQDKLGTNGKGPPASSAKRPRLGDIVGSRIEAVRSNARSSGSVREKEEVGEDRVEPETGDELKTFRKQMIRALAGKKHGEAADDSSSGEDEGGLMDRSRHVNLIKTWKSRPGQLTLKTLGRMQDTLGVHQLPHQTASDAGAPIATAYVHQVMRTQFPGDKMTLRNWRELLTLSQVMDLCLSGKVDSGLDMVAQRMKAIERSLVDGNWNQARWMELIPTGDALLASRMESKAAHRAEQEERRSQKHP